MVTRWAVLEGFKLKLLGLKFILETGYHPYSEIKMSKIYFSRGLTFSPSNNIHPVRNFHGIRLMANDAAHEEK
jgi:hypothetical protein